MSSGDHPWMEVLKEEQWLREDGCLFPGASLLRLRWDARKAWSSLRFSKQQNPSELLLFTDDLGCAFLLPDAFFRLPAKSTLGVCASPGTGGPRPCTSHSRTCRTRRALARRRLCVLARGFTWRNKPSPKAPCFPWRSERGQAVQRTQGASGGHGLQT